jgi:UDP-N-acetylglucosamine acyltransferase
VAQIHPTAVVAAGAEVADDVVVGPFAVVGDDVVLGQGVRIGAQAHVVGRTKIGAHTEVYPFAALGLAPQVLGFDGETTELSIGEHNIIREHTSLHLGTSAGGGCTRIGNHNLIMNHVHVAHDCQLGDHCIIAAYSGMGGHVEVHDHAVIGGFTGIHQFVRIGESAFTAAGAKVTRDVAPYAKVAGDRARFVGINRINLERREFDPETIRVIKHAFFVLFQRKMRFVDACKLAEEECAGSAEVEKLLAFLRSTQRGFVR